MIERKTMNEEITSPEMSDEECVARLASGYTQSFDESALLTWEEIDLRIDKLFERKRVKSA